MSTKIPSYIKFKVGSPAICLFHNVRSITYVQIKTVGAQNIRQLCRNKLGHSRLMESSKTGIHVT